MKLRDWLLTLSGAAAGLVLGRWLSPARSTPSLPPVPPATLSPDTQPRLTREDVIRLIEANGGPEGLDLSDYDLSGVNLKYLDLHGVIFSHYRVGPYENRRANLVGTRFSGSDLSKAVLDRVNLSTASFTRANLYETSFRRATAENVKFREANLNNANLYGTKLNGADLSYTNLEGANLNRAELNNTFLTGVHLEGLIQENIEDYSAYFERWYSDGIRDNTRQRYLAWRYQHGAEIFMNLKNAFLFSGHYQEASWAYLKERQMRRGTMVPWRAKIYYEGTIAKNPGLLRWRWCWFYLKYGVLWLVDWLTDLTSGYGERPLRTLWVALAVILSFPLFYGLSGQVRLHTGGVPSGLDYLIYSLGAFSTMDFSRFETTGVIAETLASIEALLGISILALLMFALGNRISRS